MIDNINESYLNPFVVIIDLKFLNDTLKYESDISILIDQLEKEDISEIILNNWSEISFKQLYEIYLLIRKKAIKLSFIIQNNSKPEILEKIICNIWRIYINDKDNINDSVIDYFNKKNIRIWILVDLRTSYTVINPTMRFHYEYLLFNNKYSKVVFRIGNSTQLESKLVEFIESNPDYKDKVIICPKLEEEKFIVDIGEISI